MDNKTLSIDGLVSNSSDLNKVSTDLNDICAELYSTINSLREGGQFVSVTTSASYFESIDSLNQMVPKFTEAVLRFSKFLSDYVLQNYTEMDEEVKAKIESNLDEALTKLGVLGALGTEGTGVDYSKIASTLQGALDGNFISSDKIRKESFEGELEFVTRDDGSVMITKNGVPIGFTTQDGILSSSASSDDSSIGTVLSDIGKAGVGLGGAITTASQISSTPSQDSVPVSQEPAQTSSTTTAPAPTATTGSATPSVDPGYSGEVQQYVEVAPVPSGSVAPGEHYAARSYSLSEKDKNELKALVAGEDSYSYEGALAVASTILNRCESSAWASYGGNDVMAQAKAPSQFSAWNGAITKACLADSSKIPSYVDQAVEDCLNGVRNHQLTRFRSNQNAAPGRVQIGGEKGNYYF